MVNTSEKIVFHVASRQKKGTSKVSRLRKEGKIPGNIYGLKQESVAVMADYQGLKKLYESQGDTGLIYLQLDEEKKQIPVLIDEVDVVKIGEGILHVSFKRVSLSVKIEAEISVEMTGETKIDDAVVSMVKSDVLVEALPADLPEKFEVDISSLTEVGQSINLSDLVFDKSKISLVLDEDEDPTTIMLVNVQAVKEEVEPVEPEEVGGEDGEKSEDGADEVGDEAGDKADGDGKSDEKSSENITNSKK